MPFGSLDDCAKDCEDKIGAEFTRKQRGDRSGAESAQGGEFQHDHFKIPLSSWGGCCASTVSGRLRQNGEWFRPEYSNRRMIDGVSAGFPADLGVQPMVDCGRFLLLNRLQFQFSINPFARHILGLFILRDRCLWVVIA